MVLTNPKLKSPKFSIQPKLNIGQPNDQYEKEADNIADQVMQMSQSALPIQRKCEDCEQEHFQMKPLANSITPIIQKHSEDNEEVLQMKGFESNSLQMKEGASSDISSQLNQTKGSGSKMQASTNLQMSRAFGTDFSNVGIHTDNRAVKLNQSIGARAFTHGNDIYFNRGEYSPGSVTGKKLLAHELVHTIQQGSRPNFNHVKGDMIMRKAKGAKPSPQIHDFFRKADSCACLVHVHNDERHSKAVAHVLKNNCNYSLIDVSDNKSKGRNLKKSLNVITKLRRKTTRNDPNEIFDPKVLKLCGDRSKAPRGVSVNEVCNFYDDLKTCSNDFNKPIVALHNDTKLEPKRPKESNRHYKKRAEKEATNIIRWGISPAISETTEDDIGNPDRVIWIYNPKDFEKLAITREFNAALQKQDFIKDNDLSTLFNHIPDLATLENESEILEYAKLLSMINPKVTVDQAVLNLTELYKLLKKRQIRYINTETEHVPNKYEPHLADINLDFVREVLSTLGLWCCEDDVPSLKNKLKNPS